jgi:carbamoyltransferase
MRILGLSAFGGEAAAALIVDGDVVAAAQEERFSRAPHDNSFPRRSIRYCLRQGGLTAADLDYVVFYEKPLRRFERVLASQLRGFPTSVGTFGRAMFTWLGDRLWLKNKIASEVGVPHEQVLFTEHHQAHAASAYFPSPFDEAAVLVADGAGEWATTSLHVGKGASIEPLGELAFPHSLSLFHSAITEFLGFAPGGGEQRVMELAAYGQPTQADQLRSLLNFGEDGEFTIDMKPFRFGFDGERLWGPALVETLGPPREAGAPLRMSGDDRRDADLAASLQLVVEDALLTLVRTLHKRAPCEALCLAGELALNQNAVARLLRDGPFEQLFVQPAAGDAGGALGAALWVHHAVGEGTRTWRQQHAFLGEPVTEEPADGARTLDGDDAVLDTLLGHLLAGRSVGWVRGRFEWGPRSLGHRSLLSDPRGADAKERINRAIKRREDFRPYSPAVPAERAAELFELPDGCELPLRFMQVSVPVKQAAREALPALVHVDGTARPQLVDAETDPLFHRLLTRFAEETGVPALLHTSLNLRGDPMVRGEEDAHALFTRSELDALVVEDRLYER